MNCWFLIRSLIQGLFDNLGWNDFIATCINFHQCVHWTSNMCDIYCKWLGIRQNLVSFIQYYMSKLYSMQYNRLDVMKCRQKLQIQKDWRPRPQVASTCWTISCFYPKLGWVSKFFLHLQITPILWVTFQLHLAPRFACENWRPLPPAGRSVPNNESSSHIIFCYMPICSNSLYEAFLAI